MRQIKLSITGILVAATCFVACKKNDQNPSGGNDNNNITAIYSTDFSKDDSQWGVGEDATTKATISGGYYTIVNKDTSHVDYYYTSAFFSSLTDKLGLETSVKVSGGNKSYAAFGGLAWNHRLNSQQLYVFGIYNDGYFEIFKYDAQGKVTEIKDATSTSAIKKNDFNILRIEQRSGNLRFLINGTEVYTRAMDKGTNVADNESLDLSALYADPSTTITADYYKAFKLN